MPHWGLIIGLLVQLYAVSCQGASSTDTTLSACDYAAENLYVVNSSAAPGALFPTGYVECANATGSDQDLCAVCSCREKKVTSVAGVTVAWVVCVGSGETTTCASSAGSEQEFCGSSYSQDSSSSSSAGRSVNVGDSSSSSNSDVGDAGVRPSSRSFSSSSSADASVDVGSSSSFDTASSSVEASFSSDEEGITLTPTESLTLSPEESHSEATNEDNVITNIAGTTDPSQTSAATASQEENIIRPSNSHGSTQLETNTGTSASSGWSGKRLAVIVSVMCGVAAIAAIAVFVAVRNDRARKRKKLGTPSGEFTDDGSSVATPVTSRLDGRYRRHGHSRHYGGSSARFDSSDNTPLASIVVLDEDDDFDAPASRTQYRSREARGRKMSGAYVRSESAKAGDSSVRFDNSQSSAAVAAPAVFNASHGPSVSELRSPSHNPIFDTSNTQVSFSSSMSSQYDSPPSPRVYESEDIESDSYRLVSATYSDSSVRDSDASTIPRERYTTNDIAEEEDAALNTVVSFASSFSSLNSTEYELRSTEASEFMHDSELPSRSALSLDVGSMY